MKARGPVLGISRTLADQLRSRGTSLNITGRHRGTLYMETETGAILSLITARAHGGPFHLLVIPALLHDPPLSVQWPWLRGQAWSLNLAQVPAWDDEVVLQPEAFQTVLDSTPLIDHLLQGDFSSAFARGDHLVATQLREGRATASHSHQLHSLPSTLVALAGIGSGLTPAGDDVLMGALYGLQWWAIMSNWGRQVHQVCRRTVLHETRARTTGLSWTWLRHAAQGQWGLPWHALTDGLNAQDPTRTRATLQGLMELGHSSGRFALMGLRWGLRIGSPADNRLPCPASETVGR